jgi:hypothetical protein
VLGGAWIAAIEIEAGLDSGSDMLENRGLSLPTQLPANAR